MHQPTDTYRTTKDLSPEEINEYQKGLDQHLQNRKVDEALLQRAWHTAHKIAAMLYDEFGATQVAVFGSLAGQKSFAKRSDIDIAVWGIPSEMYFRASSKASDISGLFKVDLVEYEECKGIFLERIQKQLAPIKKGEIYKVNRSDLIQRISDERSLIDETIEKILERLEKVKVAPIEYKEEIETTIAKNIVDCYRGIETIFHQIALDVDLSTPDGSRWHKELLMQMAEPYADRQPVISQETLELLHELLEFRHVYNHIYEQRLVYDKTEKIAIQIEMIYNKISKELDTFIEFLKKEND